MPLAKWFKIANPNPQGSLIIGAHPFAVALGSALKGTGYKVLLVDTNYAHISFAKSQGLPAYYGSIVSENIMNDIDMNGIGKLLALTPNQEVNSLAALYFSKTFGGKDVYQLSIEEEEHKQGRNVSKELRGKILFGTEYTYSNMERLFNDGYKIGKTKFTDEFSYEKFKEMHLEKDIIPLFIIEEDKNLFIYTSDEKPVPDKGDTLFYLNKDKK